MAPEKKLYECTQAGFFMGDHYAVGARRRLFPEQVKFDLHRWKAVDETSPATAPIAAAAEKPKRVRKA